MVRIVYLSKIIITLITVLVLMKINAGVSFAKSKSILSHLTNERVCEDATMGKNWDTRPSVSLYLQEAKRRGLTCGVQEERVKREVKSYTTTSTASKKSSNSSSSILSHLTNERVCKSLSFSYNRSKNYSYEGYKKNFNDYNREAIRRGLSCSVNDE